MKSGMGFYDRESRSGEFYMGFCGKPKQSGLCPGQSHECRYRIFGSRRTCLPLSRLAGEGKMGIHRKTNSGLKPCP
jgi:hypothetical protein